MSNWRWKPIFICAGLGFLFGFYPIFSTDVVSLMPLALRCICPIVFPLAVNIVYWGITATFRKLRTLNIFLVMSIGKWCILLMLILFIGMLVGYVTFPIALVKAIKNVD